jgi:hypothetical protein
MKILRSCWLTSVVFLYTLTAEAQTGPWARYDGKMKGEALISKADGGYLEEIKSIVEGGGDVNWQLDIYKTTPLMAAASSGHTEVVIFLLQNGANPDLKNNNGQTAADRAYQSGATDIVKIIRHFQQTKTLPATRPGPPPAGPWARYNPKMKGEALISKASGGYLEEIKSIVEGGGDVNWQTTAGTTPLMAAVSAGSSEVVQYLIAQGADPSLRNQNGKTAADQARQSGNTALLALLEKKPETRKSAPETTVQNAPSDRPTRTPATVAKSQPTPQPTTAVQTTWPALGTYMVGETILYFAGSWKKGIVKEIGIPYAPSHKNPGATENKYKVAPEANQNWPDWVDWSQVVKAERESFWTKWFVGTWELGEVMAVNTRTDGTYQRNEYSYHAAVESLQVNANGTYVWKPLSHAVISGQWTPAPDGPGIVLHNGYKNMDWTLRNESTAVELIIRKVEKARLYPPTNTTMSISAKRSY